MMERLVRGVWESRPLAPFRARAMRRHAETEAAFDDVRRGQEALTDRIDRLSDQMSRSLSGIARLEATLADLSARTTAADAEADTPTSAGGDIEIAMAPDFDGFMRQVEQNYRPLAAPFADYRRLVAALADRRCDLELLPVDAFAARRPGPNDPSVVALRHDIDADPITGLRCARHLARMGVPGTFYLLPTAGYYGRYERGRFLRNPQLTEWVRGFIVAGAELGIHNDALGLTATGTVNGAEALRAELQWLRSQGAVIPTTAGHNSAPSQGAENLEVFHGRVLWDRTANAPTPAGLPLGVLDELELGLSSEGTFAVPRPDVDASAAEAFCRAGSPGIRDHDWMRSYLLENPCLDWDVDVQCWLVGRDEWIIGGHRPATEATAPPEVIHEHLVDLERVLQVLDENRRGCRVLFVLHPAYVRAADPATD